MPGRGLRLKHRGLQVQPDDVVEIRFRDLARLLFPLPADHVDEDVEPPEVAGDLVDHPLAVGRRQRVERFGVRLNAQRAQRSDAGLGLLAVVAGHRDAGAHLAEPVADGRADAAVAAGDQRDLPVQAEQRPGISHDARSPRNPRDRQLDGPAWGPIRR